jgi:hypothetical protein
MQRALGLVALALSCLAACSAQRSENVRSLDRGTTRDAARPDEPDDDVPDSATPDASEDAPTADASRSESDAAPSSDASVDARDAASGDVGDAGAVAHVTPPGCTRAAEYERLSPATEGIPSTGLRLWLRADKGVALDDTGRVCVWEDQTDNHLDVYQDSPGLRPTRLTTLAVERR